MWGRSTEICRTAKTMCIFTSRTRNETKRTKRRRDEKLFRHAFNCVMAHKLIVIHDRRPLCSNTGDRSQCQAFCQQHPYAHTPHTHFGAIQLVKMISREAWCVIFLASAVHRHTARRLHRQHIYLNGVPINMIVKNCVHCETQLESDERHTHIHTQTENTLFIE